MKIKCVKNTMPMTVQTGWFTSEQGEMQIPGITLGKVYEANLTICKQKIAHLPEIVLSKEIEVFHLFNDDGCWNTYDCHYFIPAVE